MTRVSVYCLGWLKRDMYLWYTQCTLIRGVLFSRYHFRGWIWSHWQLSCDRRQGWSSRSFWEKRKRKFKGGCSKRKKDIHVDTYKCNGRKKDANIDFIPSFNRMNPSLTIWRAWRSRKRSTKSNGASVRMLLTFYSQPTVRRTSFPHHPSLLLKIIWIYTTRYRQDNQIVEGLWKKSKDRSRDQPRWELWTSKCTCRQAFQAHQAIDITQACGPRYHYCRCTSKDLCKW